MQWYLICGHICAIGRDKRRLGEGQGCHVCSHRGDWCGDAHLSTAINAIVIQDAARECMLSEFAGRTNNARLAALQLCRKKSSVRRVPKTCSLVVEHQRTFCLFVDLFSWPSLWPGELGLLGGWSVIAAQLGGHLCGDSAPLWVTGSAYVWLVTRSATAF